jgi:hypothetical protein
MNVLKSKRGVVLGMLVTKSRLLTGAINNIDPHYVKVPNTEYALVKTIEGEKKAYNGDWILKVDDNSFLVLRDSVIKLLYDKF